MVAVHTGDVQIYQAVVVIVSGSYSHGIACSLQTCFLRDVGKGAISVIAKQPVVVGRIGLFKGRNIGAIGEENIQQPIIVVIKHRNSTGHSFDRVSLRAEAVLKCEDDFGALNYIVEVNR